MVRAEGARLAECGSNRVAPSPSGTHERGVVEVSGPSGLGKDIKCSRSVHTYGRRQKFGHV